MKVRNNESTRKKALLAIAFAGSLISSQPLEVVAKDVELTPALIQQLTTNAPLTPELKAYHLLRLADAYLTAFPAEFLESEFKNFGNYEYLKTPEQLEKHLRGFAQSISTNSDSLSNASPTEAVQRKTLAIEAVRNALFETEKCPDLIEKISLYLIASALFRKAENTVGVEKCNALLEKNIKACEEKPSIEQRQAIVVSYALNSMANSIIPVTIPDFDPNKHQFAKQPTIKPFTDQEFKQSEKLLLRATAVLDRLPTTTQERRKAHRDLSLWYQALSKPELADREKKTLFSLIGRDDDSLLYAQPGGCGHAVWWEKERLNPSGQLACGMG